MVEKDSNSSNFNISQQSSKINLDVTHDNTVYNNNYVLNKNTKFVTFENLLFTELKLRKLMYVIDNNSDELINEEKLRFDKTKVVHIIMGHLCSEYQDEFSHNKDPIELLSELRKIKNDEAGVTVFTAYKNMLNVKFRAGKETAKEFCKRFEDLVKTYELQKNGEKFPEIEKRNLLYSATEESIPSVATANSILSDSLGNNLSYSQLKKIIFPLVQSIRRVDQDRP